MGLIRLKKGYLLRGSYSFHLCCSVSYHQEFLDLCTFDSLGFIDQLFAIVIADWVRTYLRNQRIWGFKELHSCFSISLAGTQYCSQAIEKLGEYVVQISRNDLQGDY